MRPCAATTTSTEQEEKPATPPAGLIRTAAMAKRTIQIMIPTPNAKQPHAEMATSIPIIVYSQKQVQAPTSRKHAILAAIPLRAMAMYSRRLIFEDPPAYTPTMEMEDASGLVAEMDTSTTVFGLRTQLPVKPAKNAMTAIKTATRKLIPVE